VTRELWDLFEVPGVSLGTSWYATDPVTHAEITGSAGSFWRTRANIAEALRRQIAVRAGIVEVITGQDAAAAREELRALGVTAFSADHARGCRPGGTRHAGRPANRAAHVVIDAAGPVVQLARHGYMNDGTDVLDVGTGSGYGCAVLAARLGERHVTSVDVDKYLATAAADRLASIGLRPTVVAADATGSLPGTYDRIIATVAVRPVPASWLSALRPGGRLVTTITGTALILTADKTEDVGATGRIEWDRAGFMPTRTGNDYPLLLRKLHETTAIRSRAAVIPSST
jgi:protein-L-isoaspartate O-methyltransferase